MHSLRPDFTQSIAHTLARGVSVNVIGAEGLGRGRLLQDLQDLRGDVLVLLGDLKAHRASQRGLLESLWRQAGGKAGARGLTLQKLVALLEKESRPVWLLLHHYDAVLDNPDIDPAYGPAFVDALNSLKNNGLALLCVSQKPHNQSLVLAAGKPRRASWLDLQITPMTALTHAEVLGEIKRREAGLVDEEMRLLAGEVLKHPQVYAFLEFCMQRLEAREYAEEALARRVKRWRKRFKDGRGGSFFKRLFHLRSTLVAAAVSSGLNKIGVVAYLGKFLEKLVSRGEKSPKDAKKDGD